MSKDRFQGPYAVLKTVDDVRYVSEYTGNISAVDNGKTPSALINAALGGNGDVRADPSQVSQQVKDAVAAYIKYRTDKLAASKAEHPKPSKADFNARKQ